MFEYALWANNKEATMKRSALFILLLIWATASHGAGGGSNWQRLTNDTFATAAAEGKRYFLVAGNHRKSGSAMFSLLNGESGACPPETTFKALSKRVYQVNSTPVRFGAACVNGLQIESPASDEGTAFFHQAIRSNGSLVMVVGEMEEITFKLSGLTEVQRVLAEMRDAL